MVPQEKLEWKKKVTSLERWRHTDRSFSYFRSILDRCLSVEEEVASSLLEKLGMASYPQNTQKESFANWTLHLNSKTQIKQINWTRNDEASFFVEENKHM